MAAAAAPNAHAAVDLASLWNFSDPALSEQRLREALKTAQGDDTLALQQRLAREAALPDPFVFDELALLHRALGQAGEAAAAEQAAQQVRAKP